MRLLVALWIAFAGVESRGQGICFSAAFLADGPPPSTELVEETYFRLIDALGKELTAADVTEIAQGENPFRLPENVTQKTPTLATRLREFEALLERNGGSSAAFHPALLERLQVAAKGLEETEGKQARAIKSQEAIQHIAWPHGTSAQVAADGRHLVALVSGPREGTAAIVEVYDRQTGQTQRHELKESSTNAWVLSSDGKHVAFAGRGFVDVYPLADGRLDVDARQRLGAYDPNGQIPKVISGNLPTQYFVLEPNSLAVKRYDTSGGQPVEIPVKALELIKLSRRQFKGWNRVPGTDQLWFAGATDTRETNFNLHRYDIKPDGRATRVAPPRLVISHTGRLPLFTHDGGFVTTQNNVASINGPKAKDPERWIEPPNSANVTLYTVSTAIPLPDGRVVAVSRWRDRDSNETYHAELFSKRGKRLAKLRIEAAPSFTSQARISPDGQYLYVDSKDGGLLSVPVARLEALKK